MKASSHETNVATAPAAIIPSMNDRSTDASCASSEGASGAAAGGVRLAEDVSLAVSLVITVFAARRAIAPLNGSTPAEIPTPVDFMCGRQNASLSTAESSAVVVARW